MKVERTNVYRELMMFVFIAREPRPDATYWPGRRLLAALDAVFWPAGWVVVASQVQAVSELMRPIIAVAVLCALFRLCGAVFENHRYRFTTWRWARFAALLLIVLAVMKFCLPS